MPFFIFLLQQKRKMQSGIKAYSFLKTLNLLFFLVKLYIDLFILDQTLNLYFFKLINRFLSSEKHYRTLVARRIVKITSY